MINELSKEQLDVITNVRDEYINTLYSGKVKYNEEEARKGLDFLYSLVDRKPPEIILCKGPLDLHKKAGLKKGEWCDQTGFMYDCGWTSFYSAVKAIGVDLNNDKFDTWERYILKAGIFATVMYEEVVYVAPMPDIIHRNEHGLHCENGPAIAWNNDFALYSLNGVTVTEEIVMTPAERLNPELILNEQNVDIQREIIKKIGADIVLKKLNAEQIDVWTDPNTGCYYELLRLKAGDMHRIYLYYEHASIPGYYYAMPVPPECTKAMHARAWILGLIERSDLPNVTKGMEKQIIESLPKKLS